MNGDRILITGGTGYIGLHLARELILRGRNVVLVHRRNLSEQVECVVKGLMDLAIKQHVHFTVVQASGKTLAEKLPNFGIKVVVHLGGHKQLAISKDPLAAAENTSWVSDMLQPLLTARKEIETVVYASSGCVYQGSEVPVAEDGELNPISVYCKSKLDGETNFEQYCANNNVNGVTLRYFNVLGGNLTTQSEGIEGMVNKYVDNGIPVPIFTDFIRSKPEGFVRDYIHMDDLVDGTIKAIDFSKQSPGYHVFNIGTGVGTSTRDLLAVYGAKLKIRIPTFLRFVNPTKMPAAQIADISKAKELLGFNPQPIKEHFKR